jgi:PAT family beta-lactamase induction signal transducer AmpG
MVAIVLVRWIGAPAAGVLLACLLVAPTVLFRYFPKPLPPMRSAAETFGHLFGDLGAAFGDRDYMLGVLMFVSPASCFALTNLFSGLGRDFNVPERWMTGLSGMGIAVACSIGCLVGGPLCDRYDRRVIYIVAGLGGAACSTTMIWTPHTLGVFAVGLLTYNFLQGITYTSFSALQFQLIGRENPLASTQFAMLAAALNLPVSYMTWVDGRGHDRGGLSGMLSVDAGASILAGVAFLLILAREARRRPTANAFEEM